MTSKGEIQWCSWSSRRLKSSKELTRLWNPMVVGPVVNWLCYWNNIFKGEDWSWGPLAWLVPSEIFPLEIRPAAQSITVGVNMISTFFIAQFFTSMLCHMKFGLFIFFGCFVVIMTTFIYKLLPETKGIPLEEMSMVWQKHPIWGKFLESDITTQNDKINGICWSLVMCWFKSLIYACLI